MDKEIRLKPIRIIHGMEFQKAEIPTTENCLKVIAEGDFLVDNQNAKNATEISNDFKERT